MYDHDYYAYAFYEASNENVLDNYYSFVELCGLLDRVPSLVDSLLFDPNRLLSIADIILEQQPQIVQRFFTILVEDRQIDQYNRIKDSLKSILVRKKHLNICVVEFANEYDEVMYKRFKKIIMSKLVGPVEFSVEINSKLISGYKVFLNDKCIDMSVKGRLKSVVEKVNYGQAQ